MVLAIFSVFLPLLFGLILIYKKLNHTLVSKNLLNYGYIFITLFSTLVFLYLKLLNKAVGLYYNFVPLSIGIDINSFNINFLIFSSISFLILSLFLKDYFIKNKEFLFTKNRLYIFLSILTFNVYMFFISPNLIQGFIFWSLSGLITYIFSYFDIYKSITNHNINRAYRIILIGDFSLLSGILVLYKYGLFENVQIYNLNSKAVILGMVFILNALLTRFFIFPYSSFFGFFQNSSAPFYSSVVCPYNFLFSGYLFYTLLPYFDIHLKSKGFIEYFILFALVFSILLILFEKNLKIIFGQILSILSGLFILVLLNYPLDSVINLFFIFYIVIYLVMLILFLKKDKLILTKRLLNKQKGFILERVHIFIFEKCLNKISSFVDFLYNKIIVFKLINVLIFLYLGYLYFYLNFPLLMYRKYIILYLILNLILFSVLNIKENNIFGFLNKSFKIDIIILSFLLIYFKSFGIKLFIYALYVLFLAYIISYIISLYFSIKSKKSEFNTIQIKSKFEKFLLFVSMLNVIKTPVSITFLTIFSVLSTLFSYQNSIVFCVLLIGIFINTLNGFDKIYKSIIR